MAGISYDDARDLYRLLETKQARRHSELRALRRYWQGDYWVDMEGREGVSSVAQLFRDLKGNQSDLGPDLKLVHNILQEVCVKYQTFLSPVPMVKTFIDPPYSDKRRVQSTKKERAIYGTWWANRMPVRMAEIGWYLPLMGDCFVGIWPDFTRKIPRLLIRSPEIAYPVVGFDGQGLDALMFRWEADQAAVKRQYPNYIPGPPPRGKYPWSSRSNQGGERKVEILEYSDANWYCMWAGDQVLKSINHGFGFNLYSQMSFIPVPGEAFNHGAVEQIVNLVEMGNALHSLMFQATLENVFPTLVIKNPSQAPETIMRGAGSVIPVGENGSVDYLTPPVQALGVQMAFLRDNQDKVLEAAGMPRTQFGQAPTTSVATGRSIDVLNGAGTGSTVEMVQGVGIGPQLVEWNEHALFMYQNLWDKDTIYLYGTERQSIADLTGHQFSFSFKGAEIVGSTRNEVVFNPHMSENEKMVQVLQGVGGGLWSKRYAREQMGVSDNDAMVDELFEERMHDILLDALAVELQQAPDQAATVSAQGASYIETGRLPSVVRAPAPPQGGPGAATFPGAPGGVATPPFPLPQGSAEQAGAPPVAAPPTGAPAPLTGAPVTLQAAQRAFANVQLQGQAWLIGEIAATGKAQTVEVAVTQRADEQTLQQAAKFPVTFHVVTGEPKEQHVPLAAQAVAA